MSYISAVQLNEEVIVWERDEHGERNVVHHRPPYYFYVDEEGGEHETIYGTRVGKLEFHTQQKFRQAVNRCKAENIKVWESDIEPRMRVLSREYFGKKAPKLHTTFLDIEVDYDPKRGFSSPMDPYAPINSVSILHDWSDELVVLVVPPEPGWTEERLRIAVDQARPEIPVPSQFNTRYVICQNERELLLNLIAEFDDSDLLCGWNSDFFDVPYIAQRIVRVLDGIELDLTVIETAGLTPGDKVEIKWKNDPNPIIQKCKYIKQLDFVPFGMPSFRIVTSRESGRLMGVTLDLTGRLRADYLNLYKKFEPGERQSYKLSAISDLVLVDDDTDKPMLPKLEYDGSLADLYRNNFPFFVRYNIRDTEILHGFERKLGYVELSNELYHLSTGLFSHITGTIKLAELALINYCHHKLDRVVNNFTKSQVDRKIDGALVLLPQIEMHENFGSIDINSLYPSAIRSLNISPETLRGQFTNCFDDAAEIAKNSDTDISFMFEPSGEIETRPASEWREYFTAMKWAVSGYGTAFDQTKQGFIPSLLAEWYAMRREYQALQKKAINANDSETAAYYDRLQYVYKIKLNSLYGALTNLYFRFFDLRMGESTTGTGRVILKHQCRKVAEVLEGNYDVDFPLYETMADAVDAGYTEEEANSIILHGPVFNGKFQSDAVIYGDSVEGDTIIETTNGPVQISTLFTNVDYTKGDREYSNCAADALTYDSMSGTTLFGKVKYVMRHRLQKQMYRVWITNSQYIDVTEDHALIGYKNTRERVKGSTCIFKEVTPVDLQSGGSLIYQKTIPYVGDIPNDTYPDELYELAGYIMGDGYVDTTATGGCLLSIGSSDIQEIETTLLLPLVQSGWISSWCAKPNGHDVQISSVRLRKLMRKWLYSSGTKQAPLWLHTSHRVTIGAFLRGWFSADGWVNANRTIGITNIHDSNIRDIHRLLLRCGISSTWCTESTQNSFRGVPSGTYSKRLTVKSQQEFKNIVGFLQHRKQSKIQVIQSTRRKATIGHDFELVRPTKIEALPCIEQYVYDIEVNDTHTFFANNILVHNTDSTYFKTYASASDEATKVADAVAAEVNASYQQFMQDTFLCTPGYDDIIKAGREIVSDRGIFVEKKRYILHIINLNGKAVDKMKVMGLDTKKTTLPAEVAKELNGFIERLLKGETWVSISQSIVEYKDKLRTSLDVMTIGLPKGVNGVEQYTKAYAISGMDTRLPGHVAASIHYNECLDRFEDRTSMRIMSGMKVKVFYLIGKHGKFKSIALPTDVEVVPQWFFENFKIDMNAHIKRLVDNPLENILKAIGKRSPTRQSMTFDSIFEF